LQQSYLARSLPIGSRIPLDLAAYAAGCVGSRRRCQPCPLGRTLRILRDLPSGNPGCLDTLRSGLSDRSFHSVARASHEFMFFEFMLLSGRRQDGRKRGSGSEPKRGAQAPGLAAPEVLCALCAICSIARAV
jgi:hypothetical protein